MASPTTAGTQVPGKADAGPGFPPFKSETFASQLLWLAIFFGLLYWLVSKVFAPRLAETIEGRSTRIARDLDDAAAAKAKAEEAGAAYEKSLAEAKQKAQGIAQGKRDEVNGALEARRKSLEAELTVKLQSAEAQITATKAKAMTNVGEIAGDTVAAIVERVGGSKPSAVDVKAAVATALKG